jgi:anti-sigma B factor antagonist
MQDIRQIKIAIETPGVTTMNTRVKIIQPSGILDGVTVNGLRRDISDLVESGVEIILVDFQDVTFMNSSGLGALVATLRVVRAAGAQLFLCSLSEQVNMIFQLTKMDRVFKTFANRDEFEEKVDATNKC